MIDLIEALEDMLADRPRDEANDLPLLTEDAALLGVVADDFASQAIQENA